MPGKKKGKRKAEDDVGPPSKKKKTESLTAAAFDGKLGKVKELCSPALIDSKNARGQTALYCAARNGHLAVVRHLLDQGADVDATESNGSTALHVAAFQGHLPVCVMLLDAGADPTAENDMELTPIDEAEEQGHKKIVKVLKNPPAKEEEKTKKTKTAKPLKKLSKAALKKAAAELTKAAFDGSLLQVKKALKAAPAALDEVNDRGQTALYCASRNGFIKIVNFLIGEEADLDLVDSNESTPLHAAAFNGHEAVVKALVAAGCDANAENSFGLTAFNEADSEGHTKIAQLLKSKTKTTKKKATKKGKQESSTDGRRFYNAEAIKSRKKRRERDANPDQAPSRDKHGNEKGDEFDLGKDGAFAGFKILVGSFYSECHTAWEKNGGKALRKKGFEVTEVGCGEESEFCDEMETGDYDIIWVVSNNVFGGGYGYVSTGKPKTGENLQKRFVDGLVAHHKEGKGLFIFGDNVPFVAHCNLVLPKICGMELEGNTPGGKELSYGGALDKQCFDENHLIFSGINKLVEGYTICYPTNLKKIDILATSSDDHPCICSMDAKKGNGRVVIDSGFTKLYMNWDDAGQARYVVNATCWLLDVESKFGEAASEEDSE